MLAKIHYSKLQFISIALLIFFFAICAAVYFISFDYIKKNTEIKLENLDLAAIFIVS